jgi:hypothetical protein
MGGRGGYDKGREAEDEQPYWVWGLLCVAFSVGLLATGVCQYTK